MGNETSIPQENGSRALPAAPPAAPLKNIEQQQQQTKPIEKKASSSRRSKKDKRMTNTKTKAINKDDEKTTKKKKQQKPAQQQSLTQREKAAAKKIQQAWRKYDSRIREDDEYEYEPLVKDQARGAAWAGGISGLLVGGPIAAGVLGLSGYAFSRKSSGSVGNFCRKTGDFTNRIGGFYSREWTRSKNDYTDSTPNSEMGTFCHKWSAFTTRIIVSMKDNWDKSDEDVEIDDDTKKPDKRKNKKKQNRSVFSREKKTTKDNEKKKKQTPFLIKSKNFFGRIGMSIRETWEESESIPLKKKGQDEEGEVGSENKEKKKE